MKLCWTVAAVSHFSKSFETYKTQLRCNHLQQLAIVCRADTRQAVADVVHVTPHLINSGIDFIHCVLRSTARLILQLTTPEQPLASSCLATVMDNLITWHSMQQVHTQLAGVNTWSDFTHLSTSHRPTGSEVMWHHTAKLDWIYVCAIHPIACRWMCCQGHLLPTLTESTTSIVVSTEFRTIFCLPCSESW